MKNYNISEFSIKKIVILLITLFVIILISVYFLSSKGSPNSKSKSDIVYTSVTIVKITDGDTIWVEADGSKKKVRFIGIDCPEMSYYKTQESQQGNLSTTFTESQLSVGQTVYLQKDVSEEDEYSRLLRYVWLEKPDDPTDEEEIRSKMLNAIILLNGYANAKEYAPDTQYAELFSKLEAEAQNNKVGLWQTSQ